MCWHNGFMISQCGRAVPRGPPWWVRLGYPEALERLHVALWRPFDRPAYVLSSEITPEPFEAAFYGTIVALTLGLRSAVPCRRVRDVRNR